MDQNTPRGETLTKPPKPARVALNVLALCFALSVLGRGLGESFTVFLKPISENFGWDRAQVVSVYSLTWLAGGLTAPLVGRLFDRSGPRSGLRARAASARRRVPGRGSHAQTLWQFQLSVGLCVGLGIALIGNVPNSILLGRWFGPAAADRDGDRLFGDRRRHPGAAAGVASPDRPHRMARRLSAVRHRSRSVCCCRSLLLPWRLFATGSPHIVKKADTATLPRTAGRL